MAIEGCMPRAVLDQDERALRDFLLDIESLNALSHWTKKFNLFDVLKISRTEIRHSNMLAWLLDPNENHGLGDSVLRGLVQSLVARFEDTNLDICKTLLMDFHSFSVQREWRNLDIVAVSRQEHFALCIENKVGSGEHSNQLNRYRKMIAEEYPSYQNIFIFLTADGEDASDSENWHAISYQNMLDIVIAAKEKVELPPDVSVLLENYIEAVRRYIVGDEKLTQLCAEIYAKHRRALDLIYENRPDATYNMAAVLKEWCSDRASQGLIAFDPKNSSKTYIRFTTAAMTQILPEASEEISGWKSRSIYYYEIVNQGERIKLMLTICSANLSEEQRQICDRLLSHLKRNDNKPNWYWKRLQTWNWYEVPEDIVQEDIWKRMDQYLREVKKFEERLLKELELAPLK